MKLRIVKNSLKVIEKMEEVEMLPIWSNQVAKNFEAKLWINKKGLFIAGCRGGKLSGRILTN